TYPGFFSTLLEGLRPELSRPDPHQVLDREHPDLSVADLVGPGRRLDLLGYLQRVSVVDQHLELHLGHEVDLVLRTAVDLGVATLPPEALDLGDRQSLDADALERRLDVVELVRFH